MKERRLRFKTCRLLLGNVWNRKLTIIQRRILRKLRNKKRSIKRRIYSRENLNSYIQLQTTRKLSLFYGNLPITEMQRRRERTSYIPFLLNPERRLDVILVRLHFCSTIPQARQPISHRKVCVNNGIVKITHFKVPQGSIISFHENENDARRTSIRRFFFDKLLSVPGIMYKIYTYIKNNKTVPGIMRKIYIYICMYNKKEYFHLLNQYHDLLQVLIKCYSKELHSMREEDLEIRKKLCLDSSFDENEKSTFTKVLSLIREEEEKTRKLKLPKIRINYEFMSELSSFIDESLSLFRSYFSLYSNSRKKRKSMKKKIKIKRISLPTHYSEVNHRTPKAVVSYGPNIRHIPHDIRLKDTNLLLRSGNGRGQNI